MTDCSRSVSGSDRTEALGTGRQVAGPGEKLPDPGAENEQEQEQEQKQEQAQERETFKNRLTDRRSEQTG